MGGLRVLLVVTAVLGSAALMVVAGATAAAAPAIAPAATGAPAVPAACTAAVQRQRAAALTRFRRKMAKDRRAYFRRHKSKRTRAAFVRRQQAKLKRLQRASAACRRTTRTPQPPVDLAVAFTAAPPARVSTRRLTYRLTATNRSQNRAQLVSIMLGHGAGTAFVSATGGACHGLSIVSCDVGAMAGGQSSTVEIVLRPLAVGTVTVQAEALSHTGADSQPADNRATTTTEVEPPAPSCPPVLWPGFADPMDLSEGDLAEDSVGHPARGTAKALMLFVDFPDAPTSESTAALFDQLVPEAAREFSEASYGRFALNVTPLHRWIRLPRPAATYGGVTSFRPAVAAVDAQVNFRQFSIVYVVTAASFPSRSHAYVVSPGRGVTVDGVEIRHGAVLGSDARPRWAGDQSAAHALLHETGHTLGLPDLYDVNGTAWPEYGRFVGSWDPMSSVWPTGDFLAWHKWKLGWLDAPQLRCLASPAVVEETLSPIATPGGVKAIVALTGPSTAFVVEARRRVGQDSALCEEGVLVYSVDATVPTGEGPVRIRSAQADDSSRFWDCSVLHDAPFDVEPGEVSHFEDAAAGVTVEVLSSSPEGYQVRVTKR